MKWSNLKNNKCPQCNTDIVKAKRVDTTKGAGFECKCGFTISDRKIEAIVNDKVRGSLREDMTRERKFYCDDCGAKFYNDETVCVSCSSENVVIDEPIIRPPKKL